MTDNEAVEITGSQQEVPPAISTHVKSDALATSGVRDLVHDVLEARFSPPPYPDDIIDQICLAIESNEVWMERYHGLVKELSHTEGDGWWKVNNWIGRWAKELTGMVVAAASVPAKNTLMKSYSRLKYPTQEDVVIFSKAVEILRGGLSSLETTPDLAAIQDGRDEVYARFSPLFSPTHLPTLTTDEFVPFLDFKVNRHWSNIHRYKGRLTSDISLLRRALGILTNEEDLLAPRYDSARQLVDGLGRATATPILHVAYPHKYGVYNAKVEAGLRELGVFPELGAKATEGEQYAAVNDVLIRLADGLKIDLWTLDNLWEWMARRQKLAPPFDAIFADRAQAEWAFDLFADAVERLGGGPDDPRFALTLRKGENRMRLNIGNSMVMDIGHHGQVFHLTALRELMEGTFNFELWDKFSGDFGIRFGIFTIPVEQMSERSDQLQAIYERSMDEYGSVFSTWKSSNLRWAHNPELFEALFIEEKRNHMLTGGLSPVRYWRITLPSDLREDMSDGKGSYNFWADCVKHGVAAIGFDNQSGDPQIAKFASIRPGDRVVAFLRNKTIGGVGVVTSSLDEMVDKERPAEQDYFHGGMWRRIGVDWTAKELSVDKLPKTVQNKFGQSTVIEISESDFAEVEKLMNELPSPPLHPPGPTIAREFKGFTSDAFAFLRELMENNNKAWMDANRERWKASVLEPMRALFTDLGPHVKRLFDPYLLPDELEIAPTAHKVLARINKNWSATSDSKYHEYYWGAFFRQTLSRQTDAQLFITMFSYQMRCGFFVGRSTPSIRNRFRERVLQDPVGFYGLLAELGLSASTQYGWSFENGVREIVDVQSADDLIKWIDSGDFDLLRVLTPHEVAAQGPALADTILDTFRHIFPVYLWAVAEEPEAVVERYLMAEFPPDDEDDEVDPPPTPYTRAEFLAHTNLLPGHADELLDALNDKPQAIFYGPPGTGKTWVAKHMARLLTGLDKPPADRVEIVQFHPAYSYEEFIEGIRPKPVEGGMGIDFPVERGAFYRFCLTAAQSPNLPHVFIIDEINRGNIPRIFGELMLLLEYRGESVRLPYSGDRFRIPPNVTLIGTMNTADRSIALVDFALRRRFHFFEFTADPDLFERWLDKQDNPLPYLGKLYRRLATEAIDDSSFRIGPSYFMQPGMDTETLARIWRRSIIPYLKEYYFDQPGRAQLWAWDGDLMSEIRSSYGV